MDKIFKLVILLILTSCSLNPNSTLWTKNKKIEYENSLNIIEIDPKKNVLTKALGEDKAESVLGRITPQDSVKAIEILEENLKGKLKKLILNNCGHNPLIDKPKESINKIKEFINQIENK